MEGRSSRKIHSLKSLLNSGKREVQVAGTQQGKNNKLVEDQRRIIDVNTDV